MKLKTKLISLFKGAILFSALLALGTVKMQACNLYISIYGMDTICENTGYNYSTSYGSTYSYSWSTNYSGTVNSGSSSQSCNVSYSSTGLQTLTVIVYDSYYGCSDTLTVGVYVVAGPYTSATASKYTICKGEAVTLYASYNSGASYQWTDKSGNSLSTSQYFNDNPSSTTTYYLQETSANGCQNKSSVTVYVTSSMTDTIFGNNKACLNSTLSYYVTKNSSNYNWGVSGGSFTGTKDTIEVKVFWNKIGSNSLTVSRTIGYCNYSSSLTVNVDSVQPAKILGKSQVCYNTLQTYMADDSNGSNYNWSILGGTIQSGQGTSAITVLWDSAASNKGTISLDFTESGQCKTSIKLNANIGHKGAKASISGPLKACSGNGIQANYKANGGAGTYAWFLNNTSYKSGTDSNLQVAFTNSGTNTLKVIETYSNTCMDTATISVNVNSYAKMQISGPVSNWNACIDSALAYTCTASTGASYTWRIKGGTINSGQNSNSIMLTWSDSGLANGTLQVITKNGAQCTDSNSNVVNIPLLKSVVAKPVIDSSNGQLTATNAAYTYSSYKWFFNGSAIPGAVNKTYKPTKSGIYYVIGYDNGCFRESDEIDYTVSSGIEQDRNIKSIEIYPNPAEWNLHLDIVFNGMVSFGYDIIDITGKTMIHVSAIKVADNYNVTKDISMLNAGLYYIRINTNNGVSYYKFEKM